MKRAMVLAVLILVGYAAKGIEAGAPPLCVAAPPALTVSPLS